MVISVRQNKFSFGEVVGNICKLSNTNSADRTEQDVNFCLIHITLKITFTVFVIYMLIMLFDNKTFTMLILLEQATVNN